MDFNLKKVEHNGEMVYPYSKLKEWFINNQNNLHISIDLEGEHIPLVSHYMEILIYQIDKDLERTKKMNALKRANKGNLVKIYEHLSNLE